MIPAAGIKDQELAIGPERSGVNHPSICGRGDLRAGAGGDGNAFFLAADAVRRPEIPQFDAINRNRNLPAQ